ncbi:CBD9-like protein [Thozetella sp. PMI_491]|nr:CBD9-like protein [Thozetella sp. PMI_491]
MGNPFGRLLAVLLAALSILGVNSTELETRQDSSKYCDATSKLCYLQVVTRSSAPTYRIAIPDGSSGSFDTILQIISPTSLGWAGFAWGGGMTLNPLVVAWPNGNKVTVTSRWATGRTMPTSYRSATYTVLSSSVNSTHWSVEVVCSGCSKWSGGSLRPSDINTFAWAVSRNKPSQPSSPDSSFPEHTNVGMFTEDLSLAKSPQSVFQQYVQTKKSGG